MALVNNVLVFIVVFVVSVRVQSRNSSEGFFSYDPDSIAENEKILRLFIHLATETANHLTRLKREINIHQGSSLNCSKPVIGTKVPISEEYDLSHRGIYPGVKVPKQGQVKPNNSAFSNQTNSTKSSSEQPIEIANRMISDAKGSNTSQATNVTNVPGSTVPLSQKTETQLAAPVNKTVGIVGQSEKVGNGTEGLAPRTAVPISSVSQVPIGQLPLNPTVQSTIAKAQSGPKGQGEKIGKGKLAPKAVVPSLSVGQVPIGQLGTPKIGNGTAATLQKPSVQSPRVNESPLGQLSHNRTKPTITKKNVAPTVPMNIGLPGNPTEVISSIPAIMNGQIGTLIQLGQDVGSKILGKPNSLVSSFSQIPAGQVDSNDKASTNAAAQVTGAVPFYRSIPSLISPTTSIPADVQKNPRVPADPNQVVSSLEVINEKMGKMLLFDLQNTGNPNDPAASVLQNPVEKTVEELNSAKPQIIGNLINNVTPMLRSFPDVEEKSSGNDKTVNGATKRAEKNGTVDNFQLVSAGSNAFHNKVLDSELHDYVNKFLDALRPLDAGRTSASKALRKLT